MYITKEELAKWKSLYQSGDKTKIAEQFVGKKRKPSVSTVQGWLSNLFKWGFCPDNLYPTVADYYNNVEQKLTSPQ